MTPSEASLKKNEATVYRNLYPDYDRQSSKPNFKIGDRVQITKKKKTMFQKSYTPRWTEEVFTVSKIQYTDPPTYKIQGYNDEEIAGTFYEQELQNTNQEVYRIEKNNKKVWKYVFS